MPARAKLDLPMIRRLQMELRRRHHILAELSQYDLKAMAGRCGVHVETIRRLEYAMFGFRVQDRNVALLLRKLASAERSTFGPALEELPSGNAVDATQRSSTHSQGEDATREVCLVEDQQPGARQDG